MLFEKDKVSLDNRLGLSISQMSSSSLFPSLNRQEAHIVFDTVLANYLYFLISSEKRTEAQRKNNMHCIAQVVEFEQHKNHAANVLLNFKLRSWE